MTKHIPSQNTIQAIFLRIGFGIFLIIVSVNISWAQNAIEDETEDKSEELNETIKTRPTTFGFSLLNSAIAIEPFAAQKLLSESRYTYANQIFLEQELGGGFGIMVDLLYFTESFATRTSGVDDVKQFEGYQIEFGITKNVLKTGKLFVQIEAAYFTGPHTYKNLEISDPSQPGALLSTVDYDISGLKLSSHLEYKLNTLFSAFFKSSINSYSAKFETKEERFTKFFFLDAIGVSKSF